jgi:hypothetical protein
VIPPTSKLSWARAIFNDMDLNFSTRKKPQIPA